MSYSHRRTTKKNTGSAELIYLLIVLAAGFATAWWAGHKLGMDLSSVSTMASILGLCHPGQSPAFAVGMDNLKQQLGNAMGVPLECEHPTSAIGDTIQQTTTGLAAYSKLTNTVSFTDGWRHWAITARGPVTWEGTDPNPPPG